MSYHDVDPQSKKELTASAKGLAKWFSVDICIKIFGVTICEYHFPPRKSIS